MADLQGLFTVIQQMVIGICRNDNIYREEEMANMIGMLCEAHVMAVGAITGACLITAKDAKERGEDYEHLMAVVRDLVEKADSDFSLRLRSQVMTFIETQSTPDPFDSKKG